MRARQPILPGEDALARQARLDAWTAQLEPRDDVERFLVGRAVDFSWQLERAERARAARLADARQRGANRLADLADEVIALGRRLFWDPMGPLPLYPHLGNSIGRLFVRVSGSNEIDDPNEPARIVSRLESTAIGCAWLLDRWRELRSLLDDGWDWQPPDRLKAIRMLGRQPMDAVDDDRVMMIYLACWAMAPDGPHGFADLVNELHPAELKLFIERLDDRQAKARQPASPEAGRGGGADDHRRGGGAAGGGAGAAPGAGRDGRPGALVRRQRGGRAAASVRGDVRPGPAAGAGGAQAAAPRRRGGCDRDRGGAGQWQGGEPPAAGRRRGPRGPGGPAALLDGPGTGA